MLPDEIEFIIAKAKLDVELKFNEDQPRDENGRWAESVGLPELPGTVPIPEEHVRLFHYTSPDALDSIRENGLRPTEGKSTLDNEPALIWASEGAPAGGESQFSNKPVVEFSVPREDWENGVIPGNAMLKPVAPENIIAIHEPWHQYARAIEEQFTQEQIDAGELEQFTGQDSEWDKAISFLTKKAFDPNQPRDENGRWSESESAGAITLDALDKEIDRGPPGAHSALKAVIRLNGFDAKPEVVQSDADLTGIKVYRGVHSDDFTTGQEMADQFKDGDMYVGEGIFGNGVYFAAERSLASKYAYGIDGSLGEQGAIITGALKEDAKILTIPQDDAVAEMDLMQQLSDNIPRDIYANHVVGRADPSLIAALNGYDAIHIPKATGGTGGYLEQYIVLNRGAMQVVA